MLTDKQRDVISALAFSSMNIADAARQLDCHRNTVVWHIAAIKKKTGMDPMDFFDLHDLFNSMEE
jgi:sugar diacid utilization regulator